MKGITYLSIAYIGMIIGIAIWTWTVVARSRRLEQRIAAMEDSLNLKHLESDSIAIGNNDNEE
tara:strand:+ start:1997 stop:2185 length:189 start_codon:yes stop_codon:yes gene_type:complete